MFLPVEIWLGKDKNTQKVSNHYLIGALKRVLEGYQ
jgi:hypothetical protein